ncbi:MAG: lysophospholipid acyltransferase family protein [Betaproteobacteria bacterium]|nr:lysophospholipid acyltransferase family protein [Betaproteobacteria bacterium]MDE1981996.1 lysophospholipid acyltransferase family protein [Betaproteobacteria bacterium]
MARLALGLFWLLQWLPMPVLAHLGNGVGRLAFRLARERRRVALINLALCFPQWGEAQREAVALAHFQAFTTSILGQGIPWYASMARLRRIFVREGEEHLQAALREGPVIIMTPHFFGIDSAGPFLGADFDLITINSRQKNASFDDAMQRLRRRWQRGTIFTRQDGIRPVLRALKPGWALYYMPDQDFGRRESIFVDFFGVPAATSPALSRLARLSHARVVPCVVQQDFPHSRVVMKFFPAWTDFPGTDEAEDTRRMNRFIEARVLEQPANYLWSHKRFKTRPPGEPSPYGR